jgi:predicted ATPase
VDLAEIRDLALVATAVVAALDLRDQAASTPLQVLLSHLRNRQLLLVLDNCEHVLPASALLVAQVLRNAADVRVVTTPREPLQVQGEHVVPVPRSGFLLPAAANRSRSCDRTKRSCCSPSVPPPLRGPLS